MLCNIFLIAIKQRANSLCNERAVTCFSGKSGDVLVVWWTDNTVETVTSETRQGLHSMSKRQERRSLWLAQTTVLINFLLHCKQHVYTYRISIFLFQCKKHEEEQLDHYCICMLLDRTKEITEMRTGAKTMSVSFPVFFSVPVAPMATGFSSKGNHRDPAFHVWDPFIQYFGGACSCLFDSRLHLNTPNLYSQTNYTDW